MYQKLKKRMPFILIIILLFIPIVMILVFSQKELQKYSTESSFTIEEKSFGPGQSVKIGSIEETIEFKGVMTSTTFDFYTINDKNAKIHVESGQEIFKNDLLMSNSSTNIIAKFNGIVKEKEILAQGIRLKILNIENIIAEVETDGKLPTLKENQSYGLIDGGKATFLHVSNQLKNGKQQLYFHLDNPEIYGREITFAMKTGKKADNVLIVNKDAIYKNANGETVVRSIDENENVIEEKVVKTGISNAVNIAISGASEGTSCDIDYAKYINEKVKKETVYGNTN